MARGLVALAACSAFTVGPICCPRGRTLLQVPL
jgi:hypothetical protein